MPYDHFFLHEIVDISNGDAAVIKNYYPSNNFVVLYSSNNNAISEITSGMTITGRDSGYSKVLVNWNYSTPENNNLFDNNYNDYSWEKDIDLFIYNNMEEKLMIVMEDKMYLPANIADLQMENGLVMG